jgi:hypothetical protein
MVAAPDNTGYAAAAFPPTPDIPAGLDEIARSAIRLEAPAPLRSSDAAAGGEGGEGGGVGSGDDGGCDGDGDAAGPKSRTAA